MEPEWEAAGSQRVGCSWGSRIRMLVLWREKPLTIRVETRPLPPLLDGEKGLAANN